MDIHSSPGRSSLIFAGAYALALLLSATAAPAADLENRVLSGYDSFIDRFTILDEDTTEVIHEYYAGLSNRLRAWNGRRLTLDNTFRFGNQTIDEDFEAGLSAGDRKTGILRARAAARMKFFRDGSDYEFGNDYGQGNLNL